MTKKTEIETKFGSRLLTKEELVELLNVSPRWLNQMIFLKKIPALKIGKHIRFNLIEIEKWIDERKLQEESCS